MQFRRLFMLLAGALVPLTAAAQSLVCPAAPAGRPCDAFHYHVSLYRPDNRTYAEVYAPAPFATTAACERARQQHVDANAKVVAFFRDVKEQKYPEDRVGPCHCDMSTERSSATYLTDQQRIAQLRVAEEIRLRVRERLLDHKVASNAEVILGLYADPPSTPALAMQKVVPPPQTTAVAIRTSPDDLHPTLTLDTSKPAVAAMNLPLIDTALPVAEGSAAAPGDAPLPVVVATPAEPAPAPIEETRVETQPEVEVDETEVAPVEAEEQQSAEETAERFVSYETQRIQNVLRASGSIADENVKTRIFEAAMERIQLLSNLRAIIEGSGSGSRLAAATRDVLTEEDRVTLVARIFGQDIRSHWAPKDASDVVFEIDSAIAAAPERVLRDNSGTYTAEQKKHALYLVLAKTQPTEDQRLWLSTVVEGFLR